MTYNECELNDVRKEIARRRGELKKLKLLKAVLAKEKEKKNFLKVKDKILDKRGLYL